MSNKNYRLYCEHGITPKSPAMTAPEAAAAIAKRIALCALLSAPFDLTLLTPAGDELSGGPAG